VQQSFRDVLEKAFKSKSVLSDDGQYIDFEIQKYQKFRSLVTESEKIYYDLIIDQWNKANQIAPLCGDLFVQMFLAKAVSTAIEKKEFDREAYQKFVTSQVDEKYSKIIEVCYRYLGQNGSIEFVSNKNCKKNSIEIHDKFSFDDIQCPVDVGHVKSKFAKCIVIDGYIESVSEIHHILQQASEVKEHIIIFARGYSDDVANTIAVNLRRNTLRVIPLSISLNENHINDMFDIALVTGTEVISSEKGQLASSIKFQNLKYVIDFSYSQNERLCAMSNSSTKLQVQNQIQKLNQKLDQANDQNYKEILQRIRHLTSLSAVISIRDSHDSKMIMSLLQKKIAVINHCLRFGYVTCGTEIFPYSSYKHAKQIYESSIQQFENFVVV